MNQLAPSPDLLRSLGRLVRGLSALFWSVPAALIVCAETARADWFKPCGMLPALVATALPLYGLWLLSHFQKQERPWRDALHRAALAGLTNLGLSPFLYWHSQMPSEPFFNAALWLLALSALLFLFHLNLVLKQLGAMLPDETLRHETRQFTLFNRWLLGILCILAAADASLSDNTQSFVATGLVFSRWTDFSFWIFTLLGLLPLAITMALIWKTKEMILESLFGGK
jgi:hypothetical protein